MFVAAAMKRQPTRGIPRFGLISRAPWISWASVDPLTGTGMAPTSSFEPATCAPGVRYAVISSTHAIVFDSTKVQPTRFNCLGWIRMTLNAIPTMPASDSARENPSGSQ